METDAGIPETVAGKEIAETKDISCEQCGTTITERKYLELEKTPSEKLEMPRSEDSVEKTRFEYKNPEEQVHNRFVMGSSRGNFETIASEDLPKVEQKEVLEVTTDAYKDESFIESSLQNEVALEEISATYERGEKRENVIQIEKETETEIKLQEDKINGDEEKEYELPSEEKYVKTVYPSLREEEEPGDNEEGQEALFDKHNIDQFEACDKMEKLVVKEEENTEQNINSHTGIAQVSLEAIIQEYEVEERVQIEKIDESGVIEEKKQISDNKFDGLSVSKEIQGNKSEESSKIDFEDQNIALLNVVENMEQEILKGNERENDNLNTVLIEETSFQEAEKVGENLENTDFSSGETNLKNIDEKGNVEKEQAEGDVTTDTSHNTEKIIDEKLFDSVSMTDKIAANGLQEEETEDMSFKEDITLESGEQIHEKIEATDNENLGTPFVTQSLSGESFEEHGEDISASQALADKLGEMNVEKEEKASEKVLEETMDFGTTSVTNVKEDKEDESIHRDLDTEIVVVKQETKEAHFQEDRIESEELEKASNFEVVNKSPETINASEKIENEKLEGNSLGGASISATTMPTSIHKLEYEEKGLERNNSIQNIEEEIVDKEGSRISDKDELEAASVSMLMEETSLIKAEPDQKAVEISNLASEAITLEKNKTTLQGKEGEIIAEPLGQVSVKQDPETMVSSSKVEIEAPKEEITCDKNLTVSFLTQSSEESFPQKEVESEKNEKDTETVREADKCENKIEDPSEVKVQNKKFDASAVAKPVEKALTKDSLEEETEYEMLERVSGSVSNVQNNETIAQTEKLETEISTHAESSDRVVGALSTSQASVEENMQKEGAFLEVDKEHLNKAIGVGKTMESLILEEEGALKDLDTVFLKGQTVEQSFQEDEEEQKKLEGATPELEDEEQGYKSEDANDTTKEKITNDEAYKELETVGACEHTEKQTTEGENMLKNLNTIPMKDELVEQDFQEHECEKLEEETPKLEDEDQSSKVNDMISTTEDGETEVKPCDISEDQDLETTGSTENKETITITDRIIEGESTVKDINTIPVKDEQVEQSFQEGECKTVEEATPQLETKDQSSNTNNTTLTLNDEENEVEGYDISKEQDLEPRGSTEKIETVNVKDEEDTDLVSEEQTQQTINTKNFIQLDSTEGETEHENPERTFETVACEELEAVGAGEMTENKTIEGESTIKDLDTITAKDELVEQLFPEGECKEVEEATPQLEIKDQSSKANDTIFITKDGGNEEVKASNITTDLETTGPADKIEILTFKDERDTNKSTDGSHVTSTSPEDSAQEQVCEETTLSVPDENFPAESGENKEVKASDISKDQETTGPTEEIEILTFEDERDSNKIIDDSHVTSTSPEDSAHEEVRKEPTDLVPEEESHENGENEEVKACDISKDQDLETTRSTEEIEILAFKDEGGSNKISDASHVTSTSLEDSAQEAGQEATDLVPEEHSHENEENEEVKASDISKDQDLETTGSTEEIEILAFKDEGGSNKISDASHVTSTSPEDSAQEVGQEATDLVPEEHSHENGENEEVKASDISKDKDLETTGSTEEIEILAFKDEGGSNKISDASHVTSTSPEDSAHEVGQEATDLVPEEHSHENGENEEVKASDISKDQDLETTGSTEEIEILAFKDEGGSNKISDASHVMSTSLEDSAQEVGQEATDLVPEEHSDENGENEEVKAFDISKDQDLETTGSTEEIEILVFKDEGGSKKISDASHVMSTSPEDSVQEVGQEATDLVPEEQIRENRENENVRASDISKDQDLETTGSTDEIEILAFKDEEGSNKISDASHVTSTSPEDSAQGVGQEATDLVPEEHSHENGENEEVKAFDISKDQDLETTGSTEEIEILAFKDEGGSNKISDASHVTSTSPEDSAQEVGQEATDLVPEEQIRENGENENVKASDISNDQDRETTGSTEEIEILAFKDERGSNKISDASHVMSTSPEDSAQEVGQEATDLVLEEQIRENGENEEVKASDISKSQDLETTSSTEKIEILAFKDEGGSNKISDVSHVTSTSPEDSALEEVGEEASDLVPQEQSHENGENEEVKASNISKDQDLETTSSTEKIEILVFKDEGGSNKISDVSHVTSTSPEDSALEEVGEEASDLVPKEQIHENGENEEVKAFDISKDLDLETTGSTEKIETLAFKDDIDSKKISDASHVTSTSPEDSAQEEVGEEAINLGHEEKIQESGENEEVKASDISKDLKITGPTERIEILTFEDKRDSNKSTDASHVTPTSPEDSEHEVVEEATNLLPQEQIQETINTKKIIELDSPEGETEPENLERAFGSVACEELEAVGADEDTEKQNIEGEIIVKDLDAIPLKDELVECEKVEEATLQVQATDESSKASDEIFTTKDGENEEIKASDISKERDLETMGSNEKIENMTVKDDEDPNKIIGASPVPTTDSVPEEPIQETIKTKNNIQSDILKGETKPKNLESAFEAVAFKEFEEVSGEEITENQTIEGEGTVKDLDTIPAKDELLEHHFQEGECKKIKEATQEPEDKDRSSKDSDTTFIPKDGENEEVKDSDISKQQDLETTVSTEKIETMTFNDGEDPNKIIDTSPATTQIKETINTENIIQSDSPKGETEPEDLERAFGSVAREELQAVGEDEITENQTIEGESTVKDLDTIPVKDEPVEQHFQERECKKFEEATPQLEDEDRSSKEKDAILTTNDGENEIQETIYTKNRIQLDSPEGETEPEKLERTFDSVSEEQGQEMIVEMEHTQIDISMDNKIPDKEFDVLPTLKVSDQENTRKGEAPQMEAGNPIKEANEISESGEITITEEEETTDEVTTVSNLERNNVEGEKLENAYSIDSENKSENVNSRENREEQSPKKDESSSTDFQRGKNEYEQLEETSGTVYERIETAGAGENIEKQIIEEEGSLKDLGTVPVGDDMVKECIREDENEGKDLEEIAPKLEPENHSHKNNDANEMTVPNEQVSEGLEAAAASENLEETAPELEPEGHSHKNNDANEMTDNGIRNAQVSEGLEAAGAIENTEIQKIEQNSATKELNTLSCGGETIEEKFQGDEKKNFETSSSEKPMGEEDLENLDATKPMGEKLENACELDTENELKNIVETGNRVEMPEEVETIYTDLQKEQTEQEQLENPSVDLVSKGLETATAVENIKKQVVEDETTVKELGNISITDKTVEESFISFETSKEKIPNEEVCEELEAACASKNNEKSTVKERGASKELNTLLEPEDQSCEANNANDTTKNGISNEEVKDSDSVSIDENFEITGYEKKEMFSDEYEDNPNTNLDATPATKVSERETKQEVCDKVEELPDSVPVEQVVSTVNTNEKNIDFVIEETSIPKGLIEDSGKEILQKGGSVKIAEASSFVSEEQSFQKLDAKDIVEDEEKSDLISVEPATSEAGHEKIDVETSENKQKQHRDLDASLVPQPSVDEISQTEDIKLDEVSDSVSKEKVQETTIAREVEEIQIPNNEEAPVFLPIKQTIEERSIAEDELEGPKKLEDTSDLVLEKQSHEKIDAQENAEIAIRKGEETPQQSLDDSTVIQASEGDKKIEEVCDMVPGTEVFKTIFASDSTEQAFLNRSIPDSKLDIGMSVADPDLVSDGEILQKKGSEKHAEAKDILQNIEKNSIDNRGIKSLVDNENTLSNAEDPCEKTLQKSIVEISGVESELKGEKCDEENQDGITEKKMENAVEESKASDSDKVRLSDLIQKSTRENLQMAENLMEESNQTVNKNGLKTGQEESVQVEDEKTDEEKDEEELDEHKKEESGSDAPVIVEASRDADIKPAHKKSHNILSGVGSKVKHSIAKVKKAITGKSSHPKSLSPK
ncbi:uncharacterized protein LOC143853702 [Tasmannia lanceolata]|uniref:uncharacterized protein LOC143853702 n=1 Tax=Tasmannia lanceolata TaxID=3420 RepID=UPI004062D7DF